MRVSLVARKRGFVLHNWRLLAVGIVLLTCSRASWATMIYVGSLDGKIRTVNTANGQVSTFATGAGHAVDLEFDANQNLFVAEYTENRIGKILPNGTVTSFATVTQASGVVVDSAGNILATAPGNTGPSYNGTIYKFTPGGTMSTFYTPLYAPERMAIDSGNNVYEWDTSVSSRIQRITPSGTVTNYAALPNVSTVTGMCFDGVGNLYVASGSGTIYQITPAHTVSTFATGVTGAEGLAFDSSTGKFYSTNTFNGDIYSISSTGTPTVIANIGLVNPKSVAIPVPEPAAYAVAGVMGLAALSRRRRRNRRRSAAPF